MKCLIGTKLNMTQVFREDGTVVPVTRVRVRPCVVTRVYSQAGSQLVQIGTGEAKALNKPMAGHLKGLPSFASLREYATEQSLKRGDTLALASFAAGDRVSVVGQSKGKGFQGVVKRHGFGGGPASHGHKDNLRMPGSIGSTNAQRVFKGTRMGGHMGDDRVTVHNLEIVTVDEVAGEVLVKGAVPGARGSEILVMAEGEMTVVAAATPAAAEEVTAPEAAPVEAPAVAEEAAATPVTE